MSRELLSRSLINFLSSLTQEGKRLLSLNLIAKFAENKSIERIKKLKGLYIIYSRKYNQNKTSKKKEILDKWRLITAVLIEQGYSMNNTNIMNGSYNSKSVFLESTQIRKEREELKNCTFKPEINKNYPDFVRNRDPTINRMPAHQRLYTDHERLKNKKDMMKFELDTRENKKLSFSPETNEKNKNSSNSNFKTFNNSSILNNDFFARQEVYKQSAARNKKQLYNDIEEELKAKYTFSPKILKSPKSTKNLLSGVGGDILHSRSKSKKKSKNLSNNNLLNLSNSNSTSKLINYSKGYNKSENKTTQSSPPKVDYKKLEQLYNDHKKNQIKKKYLQNELDKEQGITFKPEIYINDKYTPKTKFMERNKKLLEDKKNFSEVYNQIYEESLNAVNKKCSPEEFEEINKNIIDRLYIKGKEKTLQRNSIGDVSTKEKLDFQKYLRNSPPKEQNITALKNTNATVEKKESKNELKMSNNAVSNYLQVNQKDKIQVGNYTFGKDRSVNEIDKNYNYQLVQQYSQINLTDEKPVFEQIEEEENSKEERLKILPSTTQNKRSLKNNKNIQLDDPQSEMYEINTNFSNKKSLTTKINENTGEISNYNLPVDTTTFRSNSLKNYLERKYSGGNLVMHDYNIK